MGGGGGGAGNFVTKAIQAVNPVFATSAEMAGDVVAPGNQGVSPTRKLRQDIAAEIDRPATEARNAAANAERAGRERLAAAEKEQSDAQARDAATQQAGANRRRQRAQRAASQGRAGTILTSPLGETAAASGGQKTILGG